MHPQLVQQTTQWNGITVLSSVLNANLALGTNGRFVLTPVEEVFVRGTGLHKTSYTIQGGLATEPQDPSTNLAILRPVIVTVLGRIGQTGLLALRLVAGE